VGQPNTVGQDCPQTTPEGIVAEIGNQQIPQLQMGQWVGTDLESLQLERIRARIDLVQIATQDRLFRQEARSLGLTREEYIEQAIMKPLTRPTEQQLLEEMRSSPERYGSDLEPIREELTAAVARKQAAQRGRTLLEEISQRIPIEYQLEPLRRRTLDLALDEVIVMVGEESIRLLDIEEALEDLEHEYDWKKYEIEISELNRQINDRLLQAESKKQGIDPGQLLEQRVYSKLEPVTDSEVESFFKMNRARIVGELDQIRESIRAHLLSERRIVLEARFAERMRAAADVVIYLKKPNPPVHIIETEGRATRGPNDAPIQFIEFVDFQCERCKDLWAFLEKVQQIHPDEVQVVVRNQPLGSIHPMSMNAALAAEAARLQGKYWEMAAGLFDQQSSLSGDTIRTLAKEIGLDLERFERDRLSPDLVMMITADLDEGQRLGIDRTPVLYLNGRKLEDKSWEGILQGVQREKIRIGL
ncbi:MAG: thioredoxin domain-containing protein, partial [Planctomycetota bacterium]|nr:thioredoxin domain-containing protein [Planctomycetota bacterium]